MDNPANDPKNQPVAADQTNSVTGSQPVVAPRKEAEAPVAKGIAETAGEGKWAEADKVAKQEGDDYWQKFSAEIETEKRAEELGGIEKIEKGEVPVPADLAKEMGVRPTPVAPTATGVTGGFSVRGIALTEEQINSGVRKPTSSGVRWLVEWFIYQLLKAHFHIKRKFGGKVDVTKD